MSRVHFDYTLRGQLVSGAVEYDQPGRSDFCRDERLVSRCWSLSLPAAAVKQPSGEVVEPVCTDTGVCVCPPRLAPIAATTQPAEL